MDRLKLFNSSTRRSNEQIAVADTDSYSVEQILAHRGDSDARATLEFKVKWLGYPIANDNTD